MATTISIRFEDDFLHDINGVMKEHHYATKAEFVREAIRDKVKDLEKEAALARLEKAYGAGKNKKRNITDADLHKAREKVAREIARDLGVEL